jgi:hypothetical protein
MITARSDFAIMISAREARKSETGGITSCLVFPLRTGLLLREFFFGFSACWDVSPTSTVRTTWRAERGCGCEPKSMTGVAIVIPMLNEAAGLPRLLRSLAALEPPPAEVLAVDGGSADASVAIAEAAGLLVVRHDTCGRAAAINRLRSPSARPAIR